MIFIPSMKLNYRQTNPNDLDDIPPAGLKFANPTGDHAKILESGR